MKQYILFLFCFPLLLCSGCDKGSSPQSPKTLVITQQPNITTLYFNGMIEPLETYNISAPADGTIAEMHFKYGENIHKNQLLLIVNSPQTATDYQTAIGEYLKNKKDYSNGQIEMRNTEELKKLGLVSEDEYRTKQSQANSAALAFSQATRKLQALLRKIGVPSEKIEQLDIGDIQAVNMALSQPAEKIKIYAPDNGVALLPEKSSSATGSIGGESLKLGTQVKAGQSLLMVGDMSGIALGVKASEININAIKLGQKALITSDAIPDLKLEGKVEHVDHQAVSNESGGIPSFIVRIKVPVLTPQQRKEIRVGMSAQLELLLTQLPAIKIPLSAVIMEGGKPMVKIVDKKTGKENKIPVETGQTTIDSVVIQKGLKAGDEVVINAAAH